MKKRPGGRGLFAVLGADLIYCGISGYSPVYKALGIRTRRSATRRSASIPYQQGIRIDKSITIDKPGEEVYSYWRKLENLPNFMRHLQSVTETGDGRSHWIAVGPAGKPFAWDAELIEDRPGEMISWRSLVGSEVETAGSVHFKPVQGGQGTKVSVELQYLPLGGTLSVAVAKLLGANPADEIGNDLAQFKQMMEASPAKARRAGGHSTGDVVQMASEESFPASDAPSWTP